MLAAHVGVVRCIALSADGRIVATGGDDMSLRVWDVRFGRLCAHFDGHTGAIGAAALSANGAIAVTGSFDHTVRAWDLASGRLVADRARAHRGGPSGDQHS